MPQAPAPSATPAPLTFSNLRFALTPDTPAAATFPAGTEEIYALWEYRNMRDSDRVRRIWFRDEAIWHVREEAWGTERGREGTSTRI